VINLYNQDCMEAMAKMPDKAFELAIVDPPYGLDYANKKIKGETVGERHGWQIYTQKEWDKKIPEIEFFKQLIRVSKNQIIWGGNYFTVYLPSSRGWVVWYKVPYEFSLSQAELAWSSFDKRVRVFERMTNEDRGFLGKNIHPTQKPVALYQWLLKNYAKPGDKILDTHGGSMSIAIACHDLGFDLDLYEIDKDYFEAGKLRLERHQQQQMINFGE
jgi:site-specific DNA-methyltransferase (adenine-specific)